MSQVLSSITDNLNRICTRGTLLLVYVLLSAVGALGQPFPVVWPIVTDQTPLPLSNKFQLTRGRTNQAHDSAFVAYDGTALFLRKAGTTVPVRIVQRGDPLPDTPASRFESIDTQFFLNEAGIVVFVAQFLDAGSGGAGIFKYDGTGIHTLVLSTDVAPDSGGSRFGNLYLLGLNDAVNAGTGENGDIAFVASAGRAYADSYYIRPAGKAPARVVGVGGSLPDTAGTVSSFSLPTSSRNALNARGEIAIVCSISNSKAGIFVGSSSGIRKIAVTGETLPGGGTFRSVMLPVLLNNSGAVAFSAWGYSWGGTQIWVYDPLVGASRVVGTGDVGPSEVGWLTGDLSLLDMNDSGQVLFAASEGLFKTKIDHSVETVAYIGQSAPGGGTFSDLARVISNSGDGVINNSGNVAFVGSIGPAPNQRGIYEKFGADPLKVLAINGQPVGVGGGTLDFRTDALRLTILGDGSVQFAANVIGGPADFMQLLSTTSGLQIQMSTADALPDGARISLLPMRLSAAGDYVGFVAELNGGQRTGFVHNTAIGTTVPVAASGDSAPGTAGRLRLEERSSFVVNSQGQAALVAEVIGDPSQTGNFGIFLADGVHGLRKIAVTGDTEAITGLPIWNISNPRYWSTFVNSRGQVVFSAFVEGRQGILIGSVDEGVREVVLGGDPMPGGGLFPSYFDASSHNVLINDVGRVAFSIRDSSSPSPQNAIFVGAPGETPARVVGSGDAGPAGTFYTVSEPLSFNDNGQVVFTSQLTDSSTGVFLGRGGTIPQLVALQGQQALADGTAFSGFPEISGQSTGLVNNEGTVVFPARLTGGTSDSGVFLKSGSDSSLKAIYLQGQTVPWTVNLFGTVPSYPLYGLSNSGFVHAMNPMGHDSFGLVRYRPDGVLEKVLAIGDTAPESGGTVLGMSPASYYSPVSKPPFGAVMVGGTFSEAIYLPLLPVLRTNASTLGFTSVYGNSPEAQSLEISNAGVENLSWTAVVSDSWISIDTANGSAPSTVNVSVNGSGLSVGTHHGTITVTCGSADKSPQTIDVTFTVLPLLAVSWTNPDAINYGTPLSSAQLNAAATVAGTFAYTPETGTVLGAGTHTLSVSFAPADTTHYTASTLAVHLQVNKATPSIHWNTPAAISLGTALGDQQLNATADIPGTFVYNPAAHAVLDRGPHTLSVIFTPADTTNYTVANLTVPLMVNRATPNLDWPAPAAITYGTALSATQLNATASVPGTFAYTPTPGTVLGAGTHTLSVTFTPTDTDNYASVTRTVSLSVNKATPSIHWATPTAITSGTALGDAQLNATADVPGTFVYTPVKGTVPDVGTQTLSVRFTPTDTGNYTEATASVSLKVNASEVLTPVINGLSPALVKAGSSAFSLVVRGTGFGSGAIVMWNGSARTTTAVSGGLQAEISAADIATSGTANITVSNPAGLGGAVSSRYQFVIDTAAAVSSGFTVTAPTTVTVEPGKDTQVPVTVAGVTSGANVTATCLNVPTGVTCSYKNGVLTFTTSPNTPPGTYTITTVFSTTSQTTAMRRSNQGYFALWLGLGGLPFGLIWAGGIRKTVGRCGIVVAGLLLLMALASCGGGATTSNPPSGNPTTPTTPVTRQSSVVMTLTVR